MTPRLVNASTMRRTKIFSSLLLQKNIVRLIGLGVKIARSLADAVETPARRVEALHGRRRLERAFAAPLDNIELEPGDVLGGRAGGLADGLPVTALPSISQVGPT